jgi:hypothetical protein
VSEVQLFSNSLSTATVPPMRLVLVVAVLLSLVASDALACTCVAVDLERDLPQSDGAFIGTLLDARPRGHNQAIYRFRVEQVYKGDIENRVEVVSALDGAACGLAVPEGERVGLLLDRVGATWHGSLCGQVEPSAFLELTDVDDNALPEVNWGGYVVGTVVLAAGAFFLVRRLRRA